MSAAAGTVSLDHGAAALTGGTWSNGNTVYTAIYSGLSGGTAYTVSISGFKDAAGNTMADDISHSFTTTAAPSSGVGETTYYTITVSSGEGGGISPSGSVQVASGVSKTFVITADEGYEISDVLVDGVSVGAVSSYTFENVKKVHTIAASFKKKTGPATESPFNDVTADNWFYDSVLYANGKGLMTGIGSGMFSPNMGATRAMLVTVLYRLSGDSGSYKNSFSDVPSGTWYESAAGWAAANGIASGVGGGLFAPDKGITREQLAVMLYNYAKLKGYNVSVGENTNILSYSDALSISDYAYSAMQWACGAGILKGDTNGGLNPQGTATRAEIATMLERFVRNVAK